MAKRKTKATIQDVTVESVVASKIAELESQPCTCATLLNEVGEPIKVKCDRCKQIDDWKSRCVCGKCKDCLELLRGYYESLPCECTYKTIQVEETIINPETGLEESIMVEKQVVDIQCERCKKIDALNKTLSDYEILSNAFIDEKDFDKYEVIDGVITSKIVDKGSPGDIDVLKQENLSQDELITTTMLATAEVNEQLSNTDTMTTISLEALAELNEQIILLQEEIKALKGGIQ